MLRSINSPSDSSNDDHLRSLLDQRTTRAGRFSAISDLSDTPSVYSRPYFSPRPHDRDLHSISAESRYNSPTSPGLGPQTNRDRLNDPAASILDFDDTRSSISSSDVYDDDEQQAPDDDDNDDEPLPRMSLLGPRMRFHSRAPWELDEEALKEEEESEYNNIPPKKGFGFSSPRTSTSRPSGESARSQVGSKKSFETTSSQISYPRGALYALAQESLSTSALGPSLISGQKSSRGKFSLGRMHLESPNPSSPSSPISPSTGDRSPAHTHSYTMSPKHRQEASNTNNHYDNSSLHNRPSYSNEDVHPYANPDLVMSSYSEDNSHQQSHITRSDSITTVTDSTIASSASRAGPKSTLGSEALFIPKDKISTLHGKEISSPIIGFGGILRSEPAQISDDHRSLAPPQPAGGLLGWNDKATSPTFSLITLEEARAQRFRSSTMNPEIARPPQSSVVDFPNFERATEKNIEYSDSNPNPITPRSRARSISAGAKARHAIQNIVGGAGQPRVERSDSDAGVPQTGMPPVKSLKHKKSGFMRLFNGGRTHEKEEKVAPPPVPPISDVYAAYNAQQAIQKNTTKFTTYRIPVPELAPAFLEGPEPQTEDPFATHILVQPKPAPGPKRTFPPLSINTLSQDQIDRGPLSALEDVSFQNRTLSSFHPEKPWLNDSAPQSAPANVTEFPTLKLRPVSTTFSAQFGDHIVGKETRSSLETDLSTPSPSNNTFSPITPDSAVQSDRSSNDKHALHIAPTSDDQVPLIQVLQDQIASSKMAWQQRIWELEGEVKDLKAEVEELRSENQANYCEKCGRGKRARDSGVHRQYSVDSTGTKYESVVHRPRARTGTSSRFGSTVP